MALTAHDVHERQFRLVRQSTGYDIDEVDGFLDEVEAELRRLQEELDAARAALGESFAEPSDVATVGAAQGSGAGEGSAEGDVTRAPADRSAGALDPGQASATDVGRVSVIEAPAVAAARILELAQRTADEYLADAQRHAERIRTDAAGVEARVSELRVYESELRGRLRGYFHAELEQLKKVLGDD